MRLNYTELAPEATESLWALSKAIAKSPLDPKLRELVATYVSILNRCAHCISIHWKKALSAGVSEDLLRLLPAYRESGEFDALQIAVLDLSDRLTRSPDHGVPEAMLSAVREAIGNDETAMHLVYTIILINAWNRLSITLGLKPPK